VEKVASIRVFKCFRMCALKMRAFVTYLECAFTKNRGGACVKWWKSSAGLADGGKIDRPGGSGA
jgi:hypothetical protein